MSKLDAQSLTRVELHSKFIVHATKYPPHLDTTKQLYIMDIYNILKNNNGDENEYHHYQQFGQTDL